MRRLLVLSAVTLIAACSSSGSTSPTLNAINVRVIDDTGAGVGRMPVTALMTNGASIRGVTSNDGSLRMKVTDAGVYQVSVIPREGYLRGTDPLIRTVAVDATASASVQFQVSRAGVSTAERPPEISWW